MVEKLWDVNNCQELWVFFKDIFNYFSLDLDESQCGHSGKDMEILFAKSRHVNQGPTLVPCGSSLHSHNIVVVGALPAYTRTLH